jgi:SAM-dependent methyltransferase
VSFVYPDQGINIPVRRFIESRGNLKGQKALDCPAGDGRATFLLRRQGAAVTAADLYPESMRVDGVTSEFVDLSEPLPYPDDTFDLAVCQEGIEHLPNQLLVLSEFHRVLKPGGSLLVSTPSLSHLRAKLSHLLVESDYWKRQAFSELDSIWFANHADDRMYFGHIFLLNIQKLRTLTMLAGFDIERFYKSELGTGSVLLFPFFYPLILLVNGIAYLQAVAKGKLKNDPVKLRVARDILRLNCRPRTWISKDFVVELRKNRTAVENRAYLKGMQRAAE